MISTHTTFPGRQAILLALAPLVLLAGCAGNGGGMGNVMQTDTGKGALFGGGAGALIGGLIDHSDPAVGILIGAAGGALAGGLIGHHMDTQRQNLATGRSGHARSAQAQNAARHRAGGRSCRVIGGCIGTTY